MTSITPVVFMRPSFEAHNGPTFNGRPGADHVRITRTVPPGRSVAENPCNPAADPRGSAAFLTTGGLHGIRDDSRLDLGKFKSVCCVMDAADRPHAFETIETTPAALHDLLARHADRRPGATRCSSSRPATPPAGCTTWPSRSGVAVTVVAHQRRGAGGGDGQAQDRPRRRAEARPPGAARPAAAVVHMPAPAQRQRRRLSCTAARVVTRRTQSRNAIRSIFSQQGLAAGPRRQAVDARRPRAARAPTPGRSTECDDALDLWRGRLHVELQLMAAGRRAAEGPRRASSTRWPTATTRVRCCRRSRASARALAEAVVLHLDDPHRFKQRRPASPATPAWSPSSSRAAR